MAAHSSRRDFLGLVSVGTAGVLAPDLSGGRRNAQEGDAELKTFLTGYFAVRALASTTGDVTALDARIDTANGQILSFERERVRFLANGLGAVWDGVILGHNSILALREVFQDGVTARARLEETIRTAWVQNVHPVSPALASFIRQHPTKFAPPARRGARGQIASSGTVRHELVLTKHASGWRVLRDEYEQDMNFGRSPDVRPGAWASIWYGKDSGGPKALPGKGPGVASIAPQERPSPSPDYSPAGAIWHAHTYWGGGAGNDSGYCCPPYVNYNSCGGDCANFVSQCFRAGGDASTAEWATYSGSACGQANRQVGTLAWVNNASLRTFLLSSGRGYAWDDITSLGLGDMINYDIYGDHYLRHVVLVTANAPGSSPLITEHNENVYDRPYNVFAGNRYLTWRPDTY